MKILIYDIETLLELFLIKLYIPETDSWEEYEISQYNNTIYAFLKVVEKYKDYYWVGYNSLRFDSQIVEWIIRNAENWNELEGMEIASRICQKAKDVIDDANYDVFPEYREVDLSVKQIDLMRVNHYDNKNRRVSLKRLEFEMDLENIEEMPIHFMQTGLSKEDVQTVKDYCKNDVLATYKFWLVTTGETEHPLYKGNNQIQLRIDIETEFGIPCMNYSNAKIGDEIIKKYYCEEKSIEYRNLPKKGFFRKQIHLKHCIPDTISFQTKQLQDFLKRIKKITLQRDEDFVESIEFYGQTYTFAKGGIHNVIKGKVYEVTDTTLLKDVDVGGFYPATIINYSYYPYHLGKEFLVGYKKVYFKRIELKPLAKKDKRIKGIVAGLKEAGNCPYGKSSDMQSWLYDKQMTLATCITGELSLLMLVEAMELAGIQCIMLNTDGGSFIVPKTKIEVFNQIKKDWVIKTTRELSYELEEVDFKKMVFSSVNDYIGIKTDGEVKMKGDFMKDFELHKNKSARICPIALEKYYTEGIPVEETIKNHKNIYDFAIRQKATKDFHYEGLTANGKNIYNKLIRYYISNTGEKLLKIKNPECLTNAVDVAQVEAGEWLATVCNHLPPSHPLTNINYSYYIEKCKGIIDKIKLEGKKPVKKQPENQLSMF